MAVVLRSNMPYRGAIADLPPINAPLPIDAAFYGDTVNDLYITPGLRGSDPAAIFDFSAMRERYLRNAAGGYTLAAAGASGRSEYDATGQRIGMLVEGSNGQAIVAAQRQDLTQGTATGLTVTGGAVPANAWDRWFALTPTGDAAHDLALSSGTAIGANNRRTFAIELKTAGHRYVQLSSGTGGDATDYANFDLQTKTVTAQGAGAMYAAVLPTQEGAICYIQYQFATSVVDTPTVSIIASGTAGKQATAAAASVGAISARLPKLQSKSAGDAPRVPPQSPRPGATASVMADRLNLATGLRTTDFTILLRARNAPWVNAFTPALFALGVGQSSADGVSVRVFTGGTVGIVSRTGGVATVVTTFAATLPAGATTVMAFAKAGNTLRVALGSETYQGDIPSIAGTHPFILSSPVETEGFDGHLQRIVGWSHGKTLAELQALVAEGL